MQRVWAGMDIGRGYHQVAVIDAEGSRMLSQRVTNDEPALVELIGRVRELAGEVSWAVDVRSSESALLLTLLFERGQQVVYVPGMAVNRAAGAYRGAGKTDAKDAYVIADQARMRRDLTVLRPDDELIAELRLPAVVTWPATVSGRSTACTTSCWRSAPRWNGSWI